MDFPFAHLLCTHFQVLARQPKCICEESGAGCALNWACTKPPTAQSGTRWGYRCSCKKPLPTLTCCLLQSQPTRMRQRRCRRCRRRRRRRCQCQYRHAETLSCHPVFQTTFWTPSCSRPSFAPCPACRPCSSAWPATCWPGMQCTAPSVRGSAARRALVPNSTNTCAPSAGTMPWTPWWSCSPCGP